MPLGQIISNLLLEDWTFTIKDETQIEKYHISKFEAFHTSDSTSHHTKWKPYP